MKFFRWFKINGENREFMYLFSSERKEKIEPFKKLVKEQNDFYRITHSKKGWTIWDARPQLGNNNNFKKGESDEKE